MVLSVHSAIEIGAPPSAVKAVFFDWASFPQWATSQLQSIQHASPSPASTLEAGSKLRIRVKGMSFTARISTLSDEEFAWAGGLKGVFTGKHTFRFKESSCESNRGGTRFVNSEVFDGAVCRPFEWLGFDDKADKAAAFDGFNEELKGRVEALSSAQGGKSAQ